MKWHDIGIAIAMAFITAFMIIYLLPTSLWFEVRSVQVLDSLPGVAPRMLIDRSINQPFTGKWVVSVQKVTTSGLTSYCSAHGESDYAPESVIPSDVDLNWWTWPTKCDLPAGQYAVRTTWEFRVLGLLSKVVRNTSNLFTVK